MGGNFEEGSSLMGEGQKGEGQERERQEQEGGGSRSCEVIIQQSYNIETGAEWHTA